MPANYPLVSFITINYIHLRETVEFLESASKISYPNIEIIVVDNDSPTGKPNSETKARFPQVKFIQSSKNLGFAGGNNIGIQASKGDYLFFLNNDTNLPPNFLEPIIDFLLENPTVGAASPKILFSETGQIQYVGSKKINMFTGRGKRISFKVKDDGQFDKCYKTDLIHGAALIVKKEVIKKVGLMPEDYFLYYEEHDWCEQIKNAGYELYYIGTTKIYHKSSVSVGGSESELKTYYMARNRLLFLRRNSKPYQLFISLLYFTIFAMPKKIFEFGLRGKFNLLRAFLRGVFWNLTNKSR